MTTMMTNIFDDDDEEVVSFFVWDSHMFDSQHSFTAWCNLAGFKEFKDCINLPRCEFDGR